MTDLHDARPSADPYTPTLARAVAVIRSNVATGECGWGMFAPVLTALEDRRRLRRDVSAAVSGWIRGGDPEEAMRLVARAVTVSARVEAVEDDEKEQRDA